MELGIWFLKDGSHFTKLLTTLIHIIDEVLIELRLNDEATDFEKYLSQFIPTKEHEFNGFGGFYHKETGVHTFLSLDFREFTNKDNSLFWSAAQKRLSKLIIEDEEEKEVMIFLLQELLTINEIANNQRKPKPINSLQELYDYLDEYAFKDIPNNPYLKYFEKESIGVGENFFGLKRISKNFKVFTDLNSDNQYVSKISDLESKIFLTFDESLFYDNSLKEFDYLNDNDVSYFERRVQTTNNYGLKAYYAKVVFLKKSVIDEKIRYGQIAIDNYIKLWKCLESIGRSQFILSRIITITEKINYYRKDDIRWIIMNMLERMNYEPLTSISEILHYPIFFQNKDFENLQTICLHFGVQTLLVEIFVLDYQGEGSSAYFDEGRRAGEITGYQKYDWERLEKEANPVLFEEINWEDSIFHEIGFEKKEIERYKFIDVRNGERLKILD